MKLLNQITLDQVLNGPSDMIYYSTQTMWWTDDVNDLHRTKPLPAKSRPPGAPDNFGAGLPSDIFGCVLMQIDKSKFFSDLAGIEKHYGSTDVLMAMHHKNFEPEVGDPLQMFTKKATWQEAVRIQKDQTAPGTDTGEK